MEQKPSSGSDSRHLVWGSSEFDSSSSGVQGEPSSPTGSSDSRGCPDLLVTHKVFASSSSSSDSAARNPAVLRNGHAQVDPSPNWEGDEKPECEGSSGEEAEDKGMWSLGATQHDDGKCRPCFFSSSPVGCRNGPECRFCHYSHRGLRRPRPCKERRVRYKRSIEQQVQRMAEQQEALAADERSAMIED
mmetsp:Transcript_79214/g.183816  ORF Transcript_79214/g.183816 Transcript_79214/m.183816 type:complete len:189 (-) Transcript_79214:19-585(-)